MSEKYMVCKRTTFLVLLICIVVTLPSHSQQVEDSSNTGYRNKVLFLPALGSSPETGFMFGAVVVPQFKFDGIHEKTRSSSILFSGIYTTKNQILLSILPDIIFKEESWVLNGNYFVNYFPESYWGVGPFTTNSEESTVLYTQTNLEQRILRKVGPGLFTGPYLRWSRLYNVRFENMQGESIPRPIVNGNDGGTSAGVGWAVRWDRRDSNMTPTNHHYIEFSFLGYPSWLGTTDSYTAFELDGRKYVDVKNNGKSVLAFQGLLQLHSGNPPFNDLATLGGDRINRGYYGGRYRDQNSLQVQAEFRQHVVGRFGATVFTATGEVWNRFEDFSLQNYKWTAGAGLRFNLNKEDPTNIRIDYGFGKNTSGFYLQFGEAF